MAAPVEPGQYKDVLLVLAAAGIVAPLMYRLKVSPVLGYLATGVAFGPYGLGRLVEALPFLSFITIRNTGDLAPIAELGVVFLLFLIGLELSPERAWALRRFVFGLGLAQVVLTTAAIAVVLNVLGLGGAAAFVVGAAVALSSTAMVVEVMAERKRLNTAAGRATFAVLLMQDLAVVPILFLVSIMAANTGGSVIQGLATALAQTLLVLGTIVVVGRLALRPLFRFVAATDTNEMFMATALLVVVGTSVVTASAGLSMALGAFAAGLLLAETEYRRAIQVTIEPFKGLLLGLFFLTVGMQVDLNTIARRPGDIALAVVALLVLKFLITFSIAKAMRLSLPVAVESALVLAAGGEFAFVVVGLAASLGVVSGPAGDFTLAVVSLTMVCIPALAWLGAQAAPRLAPRVAPDAEVAEPPPDDTRAAAIVVGYGRVGQLIGRMLADHRITYVASDRDANAVAQARKAGRPVYFGDASRPEFLDRLGLRHARALIVTTQSRQMDEIVARARASRPDLTIVARARDAKHATELYRLGATICVPETIEASLQLSEAALVGLGVPMGLAIAAIHERRDEFRKELQARYRSDS